MAVRLPSISTSASISLDGFAIRNSRGRRVSLLNDNELVSLPHYIQPSSPHYPLSPTYSSDSEPTDHTFIHHSYNIPSPSSTSPSIAPVSPRLPPRNDLISFAVPHYDSSKPVLRKSSSSSISSYGRGSLVSTNGRMANSHPNQSRDCKRRYECATCGKTFTTSGHVARHNRIHTGEKNFQCPEPGCSQRFSRQDNCMYGPAYLTVD